MSSKAVLIWLLIAVGLGVVAIVLLREPPKTAPEAAQTVAQGQKLFNMAAGQVVSVAVERADGQREIVEKAPDGRSILGSDAEWQLRIEKPGLTSVADPGAWPMAGPQVQSMLRILTELTAAADPGAQSELGQSVTTIRIRTSGPEHVLKLADRSLAGLCLAEVTTGDAGGQTQTVRALIDAKIQELFTNPGPRAWRETFVLAGLAPDASRLQLENAQSKLVLAKLDGRWSLREPVAAPADPVAVQRLTGELLRLRITDFLDQGVPAGNTGLDNPIARLNVQVDRRTIGPGDSEPTVTPVECPVAIGGASDAAHTRLFASIAGKRTVLIESRGLNDISMAPTSYIWPHPVRQSPGDIGTIVLDARGEQGTTASRVFRRSMTTWSQIAGDGKEIALIDKDVRDVESLLTFLTGGEQGAFKSGPGTPSAGATPAPVITLEAPPGLSTVGKISLLSLGGEPLESIDVGSTKPGQVTLRTGPVYREYNAAKVPGLLIGVVEAGAPTPVTPAKPAEPNK